MKRKKKRPQLVDPPWTEFERMDVFIAPDGTMVPIDKSIRVFRNSRYQVNIRETAPSKVFGRILWLSIKRFDKDWMHDWRELQRIKNELVGPEIEAVEVYPREDRLVDTSNQYHLFCFIDGYTLPFGYADRLVIEHPEVEPMSASARQRPWSEEDRPPDLADGTQKMGDITVKLIEGDRINELTDEARSSGSSGHDRTEVSESGEGAEGGISGSRGGLHPPGAQPREPSEAGEA